MVVLIIGILSAIALPQYILLVEKARAVEPLAVLKSVRDAQEVYYMANGEYSRNLEVLDVHIPQSDNREYAADTDFSVGACRKNVDPSRRYLLAFRFSKSSAEVGSIVCGYDNAVCTSTNAAKDFAKKYVARWVHK